nr:hypothetical protein [Delftia acidovorans]
MQKKTNVQNIPHDPVYPAGFAVYISLCFIVVFREKVEMSQSINLVAYGITKEGMLSEWKTVELIEAAFVTPALLDELKLVAPIAKRGVSGSTDSTADYSIECFDAADIESAIKKLKDMFLITLESDASKLLIIDEESTKALAATNGNDANSSAIDEAISRFRTITNVIHIFKLKHDKYANDDSVVVKMG